MPPDALARFIGSDKLFFGLASGHANNGGLTIDALPREGSPYVSLRGLTGRTLRRSHPGRRRANGGAPLFDWAGDAPRPGSEPANGATNGAAVATPPASPPQPADYDDGFGIVEGAHDHAHKNLRFVHGV